jgi:arylsulfatase A-like enzyme
MTDSNSRGAWPKFLATGENNDNLAHWLKKAGYTTAYLGKFMNGYGMKNYDYPPSGWDWTDLLVQPHIYNFNHVVMSQNGETPVYYEGWHQTDVLRVKAIEQLEWMTRQHKPFYLEIAPASPHVRIGGWPTVPLSRHMFHFPGATAPRTPNWNPLDDELQQGKASWVGRLPVMNQSIVEVVDKSFRARLQGLQGIDEIVEDVVGILEKSGVLEDTFIIYTTDNGKPFSKDSSIWRSGTDTRP